MHRAIVMLAALAWGGAALAEEPPPRLSLPVDCAMGTLCTIQNHFDHDPGPGYHDYACGVLSSDGEQGTDFRVPDLVAMAEGVAVLAAAPGRVLRVRDGMADVDVRDIGLEAVAGRDAGNAVVIDHGGGWETQYSHLRQGSVAVAAGDQVARGDVIGLIGMSGRAAFPHVALQVRNGERRIDPFVGWGETAGVGLAEAAGCGPGAETLWTPEALAALSYRPSGLLGAGFAMAKPDWPAARRGAYREPAITRTAPAIVFWASIFGGQQGDVVTVRLIAPNGAALAEGAVTLEGNKAQWFSFAGARRPGAAWPAGVYRGEFRLSRPSGGEAREVLSVDREIWLY